jgi:hypothetical protein
MSLMCGCPRLIAVHQSRMQYVSSRLIVDEIIMSDVENLHYFTQSLLLRLWWSHREVGPGPGDRGGGIKPLLEELQAFPIQYRIKPRVSLSLDRRLIRTMLKIFVPNLHCSVSRILARQQRIATQICIIYHVILYPNPFFTMKLCTSIFKRFPDLDSRIYRAGNDAERSSKRAVQRPISLCHHFEPLVTCNVTYSLFSLLERATTNQRVASYSRV